LHRDGGHPAIVSTDGSKYYYIDGNLHRDGDLPSVEYPDGYKAYYKNGCLHRDGGHAALMHTDGSVEYFLYGTEISETVANFIAKRKRAIVKYAFRYWYDWTYSDPNSNAFKARLARDMAEYEEITGGFVEHTPKRIRTD